MYEDVTIARGVSIINIDCKAVAIKKPYEVNLNFSKDGHPVRMQKNAVISTCLLWPAFAISGLLTTPFPDSLWIMNNDADQSAISPIPAGNSQQTPQPSWGIGQWSGLYPLTYPYNQNFQNNGNWQLANASASVSYDKTTEPWLNGVYTLAQGGVGLACHPATHSEYDLFLIPKNNAATLGANAANAPVGMQATAPLSTLQSLSFNLGIQIKYEAIGSNCAPSQAGYLLGLMLRHIGTGKILFYQLVFRSVRREGNDVVPIHSTSDAWTEFGNWGVSDDIRNVSPSLAAPVPGGPRIAYSANILPRMKFLIETGGPNGNTFDKNIANYQVVSAYLGSHVWGETYVTTSFDNFSLISAP